MDGPIPLDVLNKYISGKIMSYEKRLKNSPKKNSPILSTNTNFLPQIQSN